MASPMADAYCTLPMGHAYCATPSVVPTRPTDHHEQQQMGLSDAGMAGFAAVLVVGGLALRWRLLR